MLAKAHSALVFLAVALASGTSGEAGASPKPTPDVVQGRELFTAFACDACHGSRGSNGNGGPLTGAAVLPYAAVLNQVRNPRRQMPAYPASQLSDQDVEKIYAYLRSIPKSPDVKDIPILNH